MKRCHAVLIVLVLFAAPAEAKMPNVVFILVDDLGYMDIGAYYPKTFYETPNVDRLARAGTRFTNGYAAGTCCSPTRFSIMTGKYPTRAGCTNVFTATRSGKFLPAPLNNRMPLEELTTAEAFKKAGYKTAHVGKWHLGPTEEFWPEQQGFDINIGGHQAGSPPGGYFAPWKNPRLPSGPKGEFLTERLASEAIKFIEQNKQGPFYLHLAFHSVHTPLQAPKELVDKYEAKAGKLDKGEDFREEEQIWPLNEPRQVRVRQNHAVYAAMVESMDTHVGRVLDKLKELEIDDQTVVVFMSDNGGLSTSEGLPTSNWPLRCGKGWVYEGGIRVPFLIQWPGAVAKPGSTCDTPVISTDFYPTLLDIAGVPLEPRQHLDGVSLTPLLKGGTIAERPLYWHYPHYSNQGGFPGGAIRAGDWKLIERYEDGQVHLYNLKQDIGERQDLAGTMPERVRDLRRQLHSWYAKVGAKFLETKDGGPKPWRPTPTADGRP